MMRFVPQFREGVIFASSLSYFSHFSFSTTFRKNTCFKIFLDTMTAEDVLISHDNFLICAQ